MKVSIIVPYEGYYNYLQDCLESIQDQKNVELETLLVGNQETDDFKKLVEMYKDTISLQVINCPIEEGVAKKRNLGLDKATGDYIYFLDSDDYIMPQRRIDLLIRAKKGIRNITVLNILIKRKVIEEHHLRFNEDFIYYSDLPFVEGLVMYGNKIAFDEETLYAKRKHNDPINTPALSQIKDETKFDEFINVYKYAISLVDKESRIRYYLDSKMIKYYSNYFAKKIRRSKNDFWRDERFNQMALLMKDVRDDLLKNMSRYQQKLVKLSRNHDLSGTQKVIAKHLAKSKLKKMLKNKNEVNKYLYRHRYLEEPIESLKDLLKSMLIT